MTVLSSQQEDNVRRLECADLATTAVPTDFRGSPSQDSFGAARTRFCQKHAVPIKEILGLL